MNIELVATFLPLAVSAPILLTISAIDARSFRIPDRLSYPLFALIAALMTTLGSTTVPHRHLAMAALGAALFSSVLGLLHIVRPDGLGLGDVKLAATLGLLAGWARGSTLDVAMTITWSMILASAIGLAVIGARRARGLPIDRTGAVPFGPALCAGTSIAAVAAAFMP